jgi:hypothetical protein
LEPFYFYAYHHEGQIDRVIEAAFVDDIFFLCYLNNVIKFQISYRKEAFKMKMTSTFSDVVCRYFSKTGYSNSEAVLEAVARRAEGSAIKKIVVATCTGRTALKARKILDSGLQIIAITHVTGFNEPDTQELAEKNRQELLAQGVTVHTSAHAFGGVGRGVRSKTGTYQTDEIIAYTLRMFGQGTKVAIEAALMAADAGLIRTDEDIISIGGTKQGADTALRIKPSTSQRCFDLQIREVICKPSNL